MMCIKSVKRNAMTFIIAAMCSVIFIIAGASETHADISYDTTFYQVGSSNYQSVNYNGSGWVSINALNDTGVDWGGFQFFLFNAPLTSYFVGNNATDHPMSTQNPLSWVLNGNHAIKLLFNNNPVVDGSTGTFKVHIENPTLSNLFVGFSAIPVSVPEASTMILLSCLLLGLVMLKKWWEKTESLI